MATTSVPLFDASNTKDHPLESLLHHFIDAGYEFRTFAPSPGKRSVFLRHDIDLSLEAALEAAQIETKLGITATYFLMLTSAFYNLLSERSRRLVEQIRDLGHVVSLHFDPTLYEDIDRGFAQERTLFETLFDVRVEVVSLHRPRGFLDNHDRLLPGVRHTYESVYFKQLTYLSDSGGAFKYGHPLASQAFENGDPIHLLLHPIWWMTAGETTSDKLRAWQRSHHLILNEDVGHNVLSFDRRSAFGT